MSRRDWSWWPVVILVLGAALLVVLATIESRRRALHEQKQKIASYPPMCFVIGSDDLNGYAPATWIERHGMKNLVKRMVLHKCMSEADGRQVESEVLVPWVKQRGVDAKDTR